MEAVDDDRKQISRQIGRMNKNAWLNEPISHSDVIELLCKLDLAVALKILKDLENKAMQIKDPTSYIRKAVSNAGVDPGPAPERKTSGGKSKGKGAPGIAAWGFDGSDTQRKISKQIGWLNQNAGLETPLSYSDCVGPLSMMAAPEAMKILKDVETHASTIKNPTGYVVKAASRTSARSMPMGMPWASGGMPGMMPRMAVDPSGRIGKQIGWLNKNAGLQEQLSYNTVVEALSGMSVSEAMKILKDVEEKATDIKNPTAYVSKAASRKQNPSMGMGYPAMQFGGVDPTGKIGKQIGWLNKNANLQEQLSYTDVVSLLSECELKKAMKILKDLEEKSDEVKNPTGFVAKAARNSSARSAQYPSTGWW